MKKLTEQEQEARQKRAYENRDSIQPGDTISLKCTKADRKTASFALQASELVSCQEPGKEIKKGDSVCLRCKAVTTGANGYGPFVDYVFDIHLYQYE